MYKAVIDIVVNDYQIIKMYDKYNRNPLNAIFVS